MNATVGNLNVIFNGYRVVEIPFFQRSYVWSIPQWERLLDDIKMVCARRKPHFMGSVILKLKDTPTNTFGEYRLLIDGQQRLTTFNVFLKVLDLKSKQPFLHKKIFTLHDDSLALRHNRSDIHDFNTVMLMENPTSMEGSSQIINAYNYFLEHINPEELSLNDILHNIRFVIIDLSYEDDEQEIFDTINSLGVRLTTAELLKNFFFNDINDLNSYETFWENTFEKEEKDFWDQEITAGRNKRANIDVFFYSFLQIKLQDTSLNVSSEDKKYLGKVDGLFASYKTLIKNYKIDKMAIIKEINEYAQIYKKNIDFNVSKRSFPSNSYRDRINLLIFGLETTTLISYILYLLKNNTNEEELNKTFQYLEAYIMRRMVCHETNKNYNQLFTERFIGNQLNTKEKVKNYIENLSGDINRMPTDKDLELGFHNSLLINKQSLGILYVLELSIRDDKKYSTMLGPLSHYSLEHIMPKKWRNHWVLEEGLEPKKRDRALLTLGNLTILSASLNISIRDANWENKKAGRGLTKKGLKQYASGLETFSSYLSYEHWNEETILERANHLTRIAKEVWSISKPS